MGKTGVTVDVYVQFQLLLTDTHNSICETLINIIINKVHFLFLFYLAVTVKAM